MATVTRRRQHHQRPRPRLLIIPFPTYTYTYWSRIFLLLVLLLLFMPFHKQDMRVYAWTMITSSSLSFSCCCCCFSSSSSLSVIRPTPHSFPSTFQTRRSKRRRSARLYFAAATTTTSIVSTPVEKDRALLFRLTDEEIQQLQQLVQTCPCPLPTTSTTAEAKKEKENGDRSLSSQSDSKDNIPTHSNQWMVRFQQALSTVSPTLLQKLQQHYYHEPHEHSHQQQQPSPNKNARYTQPTDDELIFQMFDQVADALHTLQNHALVDATTLLQQLLQAGELRRLDARIGRAASQKQLSSAFFQVLHINIVEAQEAQHAQEAKNTTSVDSQRLHILQHIYTRCQEEVEKTLPPGTALLNKLLRTKDAAIRQNVLAHYLATTTTSTNSNSSTSTSTTTIVTPSGTPLQLHNRAINPQPLVALDSFVEAVETLVKGIRDYNNNNDINNWTMMESVRHICKEARMALIQCHGAESAPVQALQDALQPLFTSSTSSSSTRPTQGES